MGLLEALLALNGLVALGSIVTRWYLWYADPPPEEDLAAPYREALHTAVHLQHAALEGSAGSCTLRPFATKTAQTSSRNA